MDDCEAVRGALPRLAAVLAAEEPDACAQLVSSFARGQAAG